MSASSKLRVTCSTTENTDVAHADETFSVATNYAKSQLLGEAGVVSVALTDVADTKVIDLSGASGGDYDLVGADGDVKEFVTVTRLIIEVTAGNRDLIINGSDDLGILFTILMCGTSGFGLIVLDMPDGFVIDSTHCLLQLTISPALDATPMNVNVTVIGTEAS